MEILFNINYHTCWGESLYIDLLEISKTGKTTTHTIAMNYKDDGNWQAALKIRKKEFSLSYKYYLKKEDSSKVEEAGDYHHISIAQSTVQSFFIFDTWRAHNATESVYESSFFTRVIADHAEEVVVKPKNNSLFISALSPVMPEDCVLAVAGSIEELGNWENKPLKMRKSSGGRWTVEINSSKLSQFEYKLCIYNTKTKEIVDWENRDNKSIDVSGEHSIYLSELPYNYSKNWKGVGMAIPVFSIRTNDGFGVGEFQDIKMLADWCEKIGMNLIQILPINDTTASHSWSDSYPYKAISVVALNPMFLNIPQLGKFPSQKLEKEYFKLKDKLNENEAVDYANILEIKNKFFKAFYEKHSKKVFKTAEYKDFFKKNEEWLLPYAVFSHLRDKYKTANFRNWKKFSEFNRKEIEKFANPKSANYDKIAIHYYIQYNLHLQLKDAASYAHKLGVGLKGDIPIGISRNSVDAWAEPELFNLNGQAGAPPDDFAILGQNWEFPTYNWEVMAKDNYRWWQKRLEKMSEYFDAYRIDHILGFFRIWEIPLDAQQALLGHFKPAMPLSIDELQEKGLHFDHERFTKPYIHQWFLGNIFGKNTEIVIDKFLENNGFERFCLKEEFDTQQKIEEYFEHCTSFKKNSGDWVQIKDGLLSLVCEVLFVEDAEQANSFHPRITLHSTYSYKSLDDYTKNVIDKIYIDYYYFRHEQFWRNKAMEKLPTLVNATNMLVCGEDLGMIPSSVSGVMNELGILSLEIQRMPKNPKLEFAHPADYPYKSVASPSTHDMSTIRGWWEENSDKTQLFFAHILGHKHEAAPLFCEPWIAKEILIQHLYSSAMLVIFPFQDIIAINGDLRWVDTQKERINIPSDPHHQWKYRMKQNLEDIVNADDLNTELKALFEAAGR